MFKHPAATTGLLPREGDTLVQGRRMLYPSPVSGRGSRLFTLCHVAVHVVSIILSIWFVSSVNSHQSDNQIEADGAASILGLLLLLIGVVSIVTLSVTSTTPFSAHGVTLALTLWAFLASFGLLFLSFAGSTSGLANDHDARVTVLLSALSQSLGLAFIFSAMVTGVAASSAPMDDRIGA